MRRIFPLALLGLLALAAQSWAGCLFHTGCCPPCQPIPCQPACACGNPCDHRMHLNFCDRSDEYIETLRHIGCVGTAGAGCAACSCGEDGGSNCCERIKAAEKLGCRFHADFCCNPAVLEALIGALQCDPCWEVRRAAAWAIMTQGARTEEGVLALYVASRADPHYMVRARAAEALDILTVCCATGYVELYKVGDAIVRELRAKKYRPGMENCCGVVAEAYPAGRIAYEKAAAEEAAKKAEEAAKKGLLPPGAVIVPGAPSTPVKPGPEAAAPRPLPIIP